MKILANLFPEKKMESLTQKATKATPQLNETDQKIQSMFDKHQVPMSEKDLEEIKAFIDKTPGDTKTKLETVDLVIEKGITISQDHLKAVHTALNSQVAIVSEVIQNLELKPILKELPKELKEVVKEEVKSGAEGSEAVRQVVFEALVNIFDIEKPTKETRPVEKQELQKDLDQMDDQKELVSVEEDLPLEEESLTEEEKLVIEVLETLKQNLDEVAEVILPQVTKELFTAPEPIRKFIQTEITSKMFALKDTFDNYQKSISSQLTQAVEAKTLDAKEVINAVIDKLDHIILKTDIPLYTDLKTERDLLQSSGRLEIARNLLETDEKEAIKIVKEVKSQIDQIQFKPQKQQMYGLAKEMVYEKLYDDELIKAIPLKFENMSSSPRMVLETLKTVGLNHEAEVSERLRNDEKFRAPHNFKAVLLKLEENVSQKVQSKDHLENMTGQQLLNKLEINAHKQKMVLNIPVSIDGDTKNLKVHVDAKKENEKIDWKNSRLYFVIHLNKLGDTGVLVDVKNGNASITIKNDTAHVKDKMMKYVNEAKDRLTEVGFSNINVRFEPLFKEKEKIVIKNEGFDVTI